MPCLTTWRMRPSPKGFKPTKTTTCLGLGSYGDGITADCDWFHALKKLFCVVTICKDINSSRKKDFLLKY